MKIIEKKENINKEIRLQILKKKKILLKQRFKKIQLNFVHGVPIKLERIKLASVLIAQHVWMCIIIVAQLNAHLFFNMVLITIENHASSIPKSELGRGIIWITQKKEMAHLIKC